MLRVRAMATHISSAGSNKDKHQKVAGAEQQQPFTMDTYGNAWRIGEEGAIQRTDCYLVQPWRSIPSPGGVAPTGCTLLAADAEGFLWTSDGDGLWRLDGRNSASNTDPTTDGRPAAPTMQANVDFAPGFGTWEQFPRESAGLPAAGSITRLIRSPGDGWAQLTFSTGEVLEVNVRPTSADSEGDGSSAGFGEPISRTPPPYAWTPNWQEVARLPGGGNHDVFCTELAGEVWVAGGLTDWWGFPAATHVFDDLWAYNVQSDTWRLASRIPYGTCYCGLSTLDGKIYVVGGADDRASGHRVRLGSDPADKDFVRGIRTVAAYDPSTDSWSTDTPDVRPAVQEECDPGYGPFTLAANGRLYAVTMAHAEMTSWAPGETEWRPEPPPPKALNQISGATLKAADVGSDSAAGDVMYIVCQDGAFSFDTSTGVWLALPPLPGGELTAPHVAGT
jgi:hypothetical protein